ncbi:hypothetical protein SEUCBS139899_004807 [Sporothrix eucalyptigena]|uniref:Nap family protein n=1 Tax=Sporothrix eucalyptigena TaxID=1812306 RepID=A0ABP0BIU5_9PEZI
MAPTDPTAQISTVTYQELADIESEFEDFNVELVRQQAVSERSLYERRAALLRKIAGFWPIALEQAPPEVDQYIQPADAGVLMASLEEIEVTRFEVISGKDNASTLPNGDPRSFSIRFTFAENDVFDDRVLEKRFWYRHAPLKEAKAGDKKATPATDSWSGLVSEPVAIQWKKGKDLTGGLLDLAVKVYKEGEKGNSAADLATKLSKTPVGGMSFFAWFGYVGRRISAEESKTAVAQKREQRAARAAKRAKGEAEAEEESAEDDEDEDDEEEEDYEHEIFAEGDVVALGLAEDFYPNAIKYFRQAQEQETLSDIDFEDAGDDFEDDDDEDEDEEDAPPSKKQRT